jgi:hypothetical protein
MSPGFFKKIGREREGLFVEPPENDVSRKLGFLERSIGLAGWPRVVANSFVALYLRW